MWPWQRLTSRVSGARRVRAHQGLPELARPIPRRVLLFHFDVSFMVSHALWVSQQETLVVQVGVAFQISRCGLIHLFDNLDSVPDITPNNVSTVPPTFAMRANAANRTRGCVGASCSRRSRSGGFEQRACTCAARQPCTTHRWSFHAKHNIACP